ncbi:cobamide remodeling phosphodiesterase CbiR [Thermodesulfobacteriota bacterium]
MKPPGVKGRFPWRLGATSFVIPADVLENVRFLAGLVDDIQILYFESQAGSSLEHDVPVADLKAVAVDHDLTYTVHLPLDISLGAADPALRQQGLDEICRIIDALHDLSPVCYDLHLNRATGDRDQWLENLDVSLSLLSERLGAATGTIGVENVDFALDPLLPMLEKYGLGLCLDIGHAVRYGQSLDTLFESIPRAVHIHAHGVFQGRDHLPLTSKQEVPMRTVAELLCRHAYTGVLTLEMYDWESLQTSMQSLHEIWHNLSSLDHHLTSDTV